MALSVFSLSIVIFSLVCFTTGLLKGHIEWHLESGLALQLIEAPLQAQEAKSTYPSILNSQCAALKVPYTGNAGLKPAASGMTLEGYWCDGGLCALFGMLSVVWTMWYGLGGGVDEGEV